MNHDVIVSAHGSVSLISLKTDAAKAWVKEHVRLEDWQWRSKTVFACDSRYLETLLDGMIGDDLDVGIDR